MRDTSGCYDVLSKFKFLINDSFILTFINIIVLLSYASKLNVTPFLHGFLKLTITTIPDFHFYNIYISTELNFQSFKNEIFQ